MKTLYKHVVGTPRSGGKKGYERVSSDAKKGEKSTKYDIFHKLLRSFLAVSQQLQINKKISRKTDVSRGTHMCLNITYRKVHVYLYVCQRRVI